MHDCGCVKIVSSLPVQHKHGTIWNDLWFYPAVIDLVTLNEESISSFQLHCACDEGPFCSPAALKTIEHSTVLYSPIVNHTAYNASLCTWHEWYKTIRALTRTNKRAESHLQCRGGSSYSANCAFTKIQSPKKEGCHSRLDSLRLNNNIQQILRISISNLQT